MKHRWGLGAAIAVLAIAGAHAQAKQKSVEVTGKQIVDRMDRDGDGKVSEEEFRNAMMRRFSSADANRDGVLTGDEVPTHSLVVQGSAGAGGEVKLEDFSASLHNVFAQYDANHDGELAGDEIDQLAHARAALKEAKP